VVPFVILQKPRLQETSMEQLGEDDSMLTRSACIEIVVLLVYTERLVTKRHANDFGHIIRRHIAVIAWP
jgi:hypothetical protein